jgi:signal transduction histidine kinase
MNYNDVRFVFWAKDMARSQRIAQLLGRKSKTTLLCMDPDGLLQRGCADDSFCCFVLHLEPETALITNLVEKLVRARPLAAIILFSFEKVDDSVYRRFIRHGVNDILEFDEGVDENTVPATLLSALNNRWRIYRQLEAERKRTYQATVVTAHHEINQPLTVILNSLGLISMELEKNHTGNTMSKRYVEFIERSARRIQDILQQFKKIDRPKLINYTANVPMIQIRDDNSDISRTIPLNSNERFVLLYDKVSEFRQLETTTLVDAGFKPLIAESANDAIRLARQYANRLHAAVIGLENDISEVEELVFELNVHTLRLPVFISMDEMNRPQNGSLGSEGVHGFLRRPFIAEQFTTLLDRSSSVISFR